MEQSQREHKNRRAHGHTPTRTLSRSKSEKIAQKPASPAKNLMALRAHGKIWPNFLGARMTSGESQRSVTMLLRAWRDGDEAALETLAPLVYAELRRQARRYMSLESPDHTLESCALVHEVFLRMMEWKRIQWRDRQQFYATTATLMRRVLIDFARRQTYQKRGGSMRPVVLDEAALAAEQRADKFIALDDALDLLAAIEPRKARVVELRFFGGLSMEEVAEALNIDPSTVLRDWKFAKSWLRREMLRVSYDS
jgi:RNA polymerase sigma factor (TIGR02999 family)